MPIIRFKAFKDGHPLKQMYLNGSYLFAQDEIPIRSQLQFEKGELIGVRHTETPVGLATLWDVNGFGKLLLETTRLPEQKQQYNLNVEIARARLLRISQKREDWGMTDPGVANEHHELVDVALDKFIEALCCLDEGEKASQLADESLALAMRAGQAMAFSHARMFLERRSSTQGFGRHSFGCCLDPARIKDQKYLKFLKENFHLVTVPVTWRQIEPKEQEPDFALLDECINWLSRNRIAVKVGPLINFSNASLPDWLYIWENDFEQVREMAYDHITRIVERYGQKVQAWDVISGMNSDNCFKFSFEQIIEMTRTAALAAKRAAHRALVVIEITEPWGEYYATNQRTVPPMIYADMIGQSGVHFDGFGIKFRYDYGGSAMRIRDMLGLSSLLDRFAVFSKPVHLACIQVPSQPEKPSKNDKIGQLAFWADTWNEQTQAEWLEQVYRIALSKPHVDTITWQDLADRKDGLLKKGGLLNTDLSSKPAFTRLCELKKKLVRSSHKSSQKNNSPTAHTSLRYLALTLIYHKRMIGYMSWQRLKGKFIVLDGPDGTGKSTQVDLLVDFLKGKGVESLTVRDPGGTAIGEKIRHILLDNQNGEMSVRCETLLYMASRAQLYHEYIAPGLQKNICVICDRWISSTYAYQAEAGNMGAGMVLNLAQVALERTWPDLTIVIDIPSELGLTRVGKSPDRMEQKPREYHRRVRQAFLDLARSRSDFRVVQGEGTVSQVHQRICEVLHQYVDS